MVTEEQAVRSSADSGWKEILEKYLPRFLEFFFPDAGGDIKPTRCKFQDSEFQKIAQGGATGRQYVDKLVRVSIRGGGRKWLLIHIEVQGQRDRQFEKRLFLYNNRIFDYYDREVVTMAVCADRSPSFRPGHYEFSRWGCSHRFDFPSVKLLDYRDRIEELERSDNPFAAVTLAHLRLMECRRIAKKKLLWKTTLVKSLYGKGWKKKDILNLYRFIDWLITLPKGMEKMFHDDIQRFEEEMKMPFITTAERIGMEKERARSEQKLQEERTESERKLREERAEHERKRREEKRESARRLIAEGVEREKVKAALELSDEDMEGL